MPIEDKAILRERLSIDRIVVIGASTSPGKAAHDVPAYLQRQGYTLDPINPFAETVLGETAYNSLEEVPGPIKLLDVFRPSDEVSNIVDAAIERGDVEVIWLQLGIHDDDAVQRAEDAGIEVVQDRCIKVVHGELFS